MWKVPHQATQDTYSNTFEAFPTDTTFRPPRVTPVPRIHGCQTAVVVGKTGEEITTDQYGRVKVKFHWDQAAAADETSSCWMRVAQTWAGKQWGILSAANRPGGGRQLPRGRSQPADHHRTVYNAKQTVPYALPDNQTRSTVKTDSSKGGGGCERDPVRGQDRRGRPLRPGAEGHERVGPERPDRHNQEARTVTVEDADTRCPDREDGKEDARRRRRRNARQRRRAHLLITNDLELTVGGKLHAESHRRSHAERDRRREDRIGRRRQPERERRGQPEAAGAMSSESAEHHRQGGANLTRRPARRSRKAGATHNVEPGAILVHQRRDGENQLMAQTVPNTSSLRERRDQSPAPPQGRPAARPVPHCPPDGTPMMRAIFENGGSRGQRPSTRRMARSRESTFHAGCWTVSRRARERRAERETALP